MSGKGELKGAAQHLERGMARYAEGDLVGALVEFEKALELFGSSRGKQFASWVREVQQGINGPPTLDDDALQAMSEALDEPKSGKRPRPPQVMHEPEPTRPERGRKLTPPPVMSSAERPPRPAPPTQMETAATMTLPEPPPFGGRGSAAPPPVPGAAPPPKGSRDAGPGESPWDPVPLTPTGTEKPPQLRGSRRTDDQMAELQSQPTKAAPPPPKPVEPGSSSTILGMPALEPKLLTPQNRKRGKVTEDRPESVTREFRSATPTGPNLRPLDVPELTDEQIQSLLSLDSPLIPEGRTTPE
ncbi:MAG: hypothetical protein ACXVDD_22070, partial [Polyangia bacterium]